MSFMFGRRGNSVQKLVSTQHEETMVYLRVRDKEMQREFRRRDEEMQEAFERRDEKMKEEFKRRDEEMREFNREILLRNEKVYTAMIAQLERSTEQMHASVEETRAQTQALLRLIDRFDEPGGAAAA